MRTTRSEQDLLESLPPRLDGLFDHAATSRATAAEWSNRPLTAPTARISAAFTRIIDVRPARLEALEAWWTRRPRNNRAKNQEVRIARGLTVGSPQRDASGTWRMRGHLRSPWLQWSIPVELTLWPWLGEWTKLSLEPGKHVLVTRRYFRKGHQMLDALADRLACELHIS